MESTTMGLVRGTVIVAFALGLPAVAVFGVPDEVRVLLESDKLPWNAAKPATTPEIEHDHAHEFGTSELLAEQGGAHGDIDDSQPPSFFARTGTTHASDAGDADAGSRIALASAEARVLRRPMYRPLASKETSQFVRHVPTDDLSGQVRQMAYQEPLTRETPSDSSAVREVEARLRALGASRYQLQQASDGQYRFTCLCENQRREEQRFESVSSDRLQAMLTVLDQVSAWHASEMAGLSPTFYQR